MISRTPAILSVSLCALIITTSCVGLLTPDFYARETANWRAQSLGQDMVNLFMIVPCLIVALIFSYKKRIAIFIWAGVNLYLIYTFLLYCFDVQFNQLFLLYCLCLGLSFYSFIYFFLEAAPSQISIHRIRLLRVIAVYFIGIAAFFYLAWLGDVVPAMLRDTVPQSVTAAGLPTNGVHVLDLSIVLPGIFLTGLALLRGGQLSMILAPVILTFFILMDITIATLVIMMQISGVGGEVSIAVIMGVLAIFSIVLLVWYLRSLKF